MNDSEQKYRIARGEYGGPYGAKYHDKITFNGDIFLNVENPITIASVAVCMNMAFKAGMLQARLEQELNHE